MKINVYFVLTGNTDYAIIAAVKGGWAFLKTQRAKQ